jgi:hypothetical protein
MWTVPAVFVIVFILFLWLHFVLALQIASTARQIQIGTEKLNKLDRSHAALQREIAEAESPRAMAARAKDLGYQPQVPIYLPLSRPISQSGNETGEVAEEVTPGTRSPSMWNAVAEGLSTWAQAKNAP